MTNKRDATIRREWQAADRAAAERAAWATGEDARILRKRAEYAAWCAGVIADVTGGALDAPAVQS